MLKQKTKQGDNYLQSTRPNLGQLLSMLKLNIAFTQGQGNIVIDSNGKRYLDMTGSYGANLLGHGNEIRSIAADYLQSNSLSFMQGSIRHEAGELSAQVNKLLQSEYSKETEWITMQGNSGAEAVEITCKAALLNHSDFVKKEKLKINELYNKVLIQLKADSYDYNLVSAKHSMTLNNIEKSAKILAVENGFHGKTLSALDLTYNQSFKSFQFKEQQSEFISFNDVEDMKEKFSNGNIQIEYPVMEEGVLVWKKYIFSKIAALILEPIQGEGGINKVSSNFLECARDLCNKTKSFLIYDEIQCGSFRTGYMSNGSVHKVMPDCLIFGKVISAGFAKIALVSINKKKFPKELDSIHSSTYAEDDLSSFVARKTLQAVQKQYLEKEEVISYLHKCLNKLVANSDNFKELRGEGLMIGLQINSDISLKTYEFKFFSDMKMLGHLFSSALLNNEGIRLAPTLSNQLALRIQPSVKITKEEVDQLIDGLKKFDIALKYNDASYFLCHIFPEFKIGPMNPIKEDIAGTLAQQMKAPTFFLNHVIESKGIKDILTSLQYIDSEIIENLIIDIFEHLEFSPYFAKRIKGNNNNEIDIVMMSLPMSSSIIYDVYRSSKRHLLVDKMQKAIQKCHSLGGTTVGLGQFTSITSKNGLYLHSPGVNLTTGNSYTAQLAYEAGKREIRQGRPVTGFIGFGGNIITTLVSLALDDAKKIILFHRAKEIYPKKVLKLINEIIIYAQANELSTPLLDQIKLVKRKMNGELIENIEEYKQFIEITNDINRVNECDLIYTGTNSTDYILNDHMLKEGAVCVDLAVPGDYDTENRDNRKEILVIKGGVARFPELYNKDVHIQIPSFPLRENESFACMAETFSLGLSGTKDKLKIGPININDIREINLVAKDAGFCLSSYKKENSF